MLVRSYSNREVLRIMAHFSLSPHLPPHRWVFLTLIPRSFGAVETIEGKTSPPLGKTIKEEGNGEGFFKSRDLQSRSTSVRGNGLQRCFSKVVARS